MCDMSRLPPQKYSHSTLAHQLSMAVFTLLLVLLFERSMVQTSTTHSNLATRNDVHPSNPSLWWFHSFQSALPRFSQLSRTLPGNSFGPSVFLYGFSNSKFLVLQKFHLNCFWLYFTLVHNMSQRFTVLVGQSSIWTLFFMRFPLAASPNRRARSTAQRPAGPYKKPPKSGDFAGSNDSINHFKTGGKDYPLLPNMYQRHRFKPFEYPPVIALRKSNQQKGSDL